MIQAYYIFIQVINIVCDVCIQYVFIYITIINLVQP